MNDVSRVSRKMSWREPPRRVSVLAEMALRREKIAQRLGELREINSLTQEQAAAKVGVTLRQWQRWEAGESVPYPRNMDVVASHFGLSVSEFFDNEPLAGGSPRVLVLEAKVEELERQLEMVLAHLDIRPLTPGEVADETERVIQQLADKKPQAAPAPRARRGSTAS